MDKKQFDNIEHRIREAAENLSPPFEEEAWRKMEVLLDNEFGKDRRRVAWWLPLLLLLLLTGAGTYFYTRESAIKKVKSEQFKAKNPYAQGGRASRNAHPAGGPGDHIVDVDAPATRIGDKQTGNSQPGAGSPAGKPPELQTTVSKETMKVTQNNHPFGGVEKVPAGIYHSKKLNNSTKHGKLPAADQSDISQKSYRKSTETNGEAETSKSGSGDKSPSGDRSATETSEINSTEANANASQSKAPEKASNKKEQVSADSILQKASTAKSLSTVKPKVASKLYFLASIAPEVNDVRNIKINRASAVFGLGVGYRLSKKLSIQTGFYMGRKIYSAGPSDYVFKKGSYLSMVNMHSINGDCMVYDIPLTVRYNFSQKKRYSLYAAPGISSYIMKKEDYEYTFNHPGSTTETKSLYTYSGNKHLLSVLNLAAGYERQVSGAVSIHAEPYLKIPLTGVGDGKVKLYSGGISFGVKYQPLKNKR